MSKCFKNGTLQRKNPFSHHTSLHSTSQKICLWVQPINNQLSNRSPRNKPDHVRPNWVSRKQILGAGDVSRGGTSATRRQKFHTDDVNQCLRNICGSHGVSHPNLFKFMFFLVDFTKVLFSSAKSSSKTQMLLLEKNIFHQF